MPPSAPPIISSGASTPPDVPEPSETAQITDLTSKMPAMAPIAHVALEQRADGVVTHAQRLRENEPAQSDHQPADRRPPHPMDGQLRKCVFGCVDRAGEQRREHAGQQPADHAAKQSLRSDEYRMRRNRKQRSKHRECSAALLPRSRWPARPEPGCAASIQTAAAPPQAAPRRWEMRRSPTCPRPRLPPATFCARRWSGGRIARSSIRTRRPS